MDKPIVTSLVAANIPTQRFLYSPQTTQRFLYLPDNTRFQYSPDNTRFYTHHRQHKIQYLPQTTQDSILATDNTRFLYLPQTTQDFSTRQTTQDSILITDNTRFNTCHRQHKIQYLPQTMWGPARLRRGQWSLFLLLHRSAHLVGEVVGWSGLARS